MRVELELNEQKKRINTLESVAETKPSHYVPDLVKLTKNAQGNFVLGITTSFGVIYNSYINKSYNSWVQKDINEQGLKTNRNIWPLRVPVHMTNKTEGKQVTFFF